MLTTILAIAGFMVYIFIGAMIGLVTGGGDDDFSWVVFNAAFWPGAIVLWIPIKFAIFVYEKIKLWRLTHK